MSALLQPLLDARTVWHAGRHVRTTLDAEPTGHRALDALLPDGGLPRAGLTELLVSHDGVGEISVLLPALARLSANGQRVVLVAPPCIPFAPAWQQAGVQLSMLTVLDANAHDARWAMEQCLRSGSCAMVVGWPDTADAQVIRRLQVAAQAGRCIGVAVRDACHVVNPSPAVLRLQHRHGQWHVRKCRGSAVPAAGVSILH